jgi:imidazolonepropionase-like amidohydrolase
VNAADLIGDPKDIGSIEPGKFADIVAVAGDPLKDITEMERVTFVMKGGIVYKSNNREVVSQTAPDLSYTNYYENGVS